MDDFLIIYRILKHLNDSMDFEEFDSGGFTAGRFGTNPNRFHALLVQLQEDGSIKGLEVRHDMRQAPYIQAPMAPRMTLKGLEYLNDNTMMKKAANLAKGIVDILT